MVTKIFGCDCCGQRVELELPAGTVAPGECFGCRQDCDHLGQCRGVDPPGELYPEADAGS